MPDGAPAGFAGVTRMFRAHDTRSLQSALIALAAARFGGRHRRRRRSSKRRRSTRRLLSAAGISAATSTTIGPTWTAPTTSSTPCPTAPTGTFDTDRARRRLVARRRRRLPDHQLPAHRPDGRLLVRLRLQRLDIRRLRRRALLVRGHLQLFRLGCCWPTPMPISAPMPASRPMSAPASAARRSAGTTCATRSTASSPCIRAPTNGASPGL